MALHLDQRLVALMALRVRRAEADAVGDRGGEWHWIAEHLTEALERFFDQMPAEGEHAGWDAVAEELIREIVDTVTPLPDESEEGE